MDATKTQPENATKDASAATLVPVAPGSVVWYVETNVDGEDEPVRYGPYITEAVAQQDADQMPASWRATVVPVTVLGAAPRRITHYRASFISDREGKVSADSPQIRLWEFSSLDADLPEDARVPVKVVVTGRSVLITGLDRAAVLASYVAEYNRRLAD